jgi:tetratricopeptide (TPR) repeat protein
MKRGTSIRAMGALLGALMTLSVAVRGAQNNQPKTPEQSEDFQKSPKQTARLSDEERADVFMARKSYAEAIQFYSLAIKSKPVTPQNQTEVAVLWNKMGICYQQMMGYGEARKAYKQAIQVDRDYAQAWNNLGTTFYLNKRPKKSIKFYRRAIKLSPQVASFHWNLGTSYFVRKKYKKATAEYRAAIQLDPDIIRQNSRQGTVVETRQANAKFYFYMAKIFASIGNASEAVRYLEHAMEEGFHDRSRILQDPDIKKISKDPAFVALMKNPPVAIKN